jgi:CDP-glucose 4,6-dehydratase
VRNPHATRPWQHVLEPLSGYLWLATTLAQPELVSAEAKDILTAFNFGPEKEANRNVGDLVGEILKSWPGRWEDKSDPHAHHEAKLLMLSTARAKRVLHWQPTWNFETAIARTVEWYRGVNESAAAAESLTLRQIADYEATARATNTAPKSFGSPANFPPPRTPPTGPARMQSVPRSSPARPPCLTPVAFSPKTKSRPPFPPR